MMGRFFQRAGRFTALLWWYLGGLVVFAALRLALWVQLGHNAPRISEGIRALGTGILFDIAVLSWLTLPLVLLLGLSRRILERVPRFWWPLLWLGVVVLYFQVLAEWLFWDEFNSRFNFIAVDYLIYTNEVIGNIRQSYPVGILLSAIASLAVITVWQIRRIIKASALTPLTYRWRWIAAGCALPWILTSSIGALPIGQASNAFVQALGQNGLWELAAAFRHNELSYHAFYPTRPRETVCTQLRQLVATPKSRFIHNEMCDIRRTITPTEAPRRLNVVLVTMESLSAEFIGALGDKRGLTPEFDQLSRQGLLFTQLYATGTRTVRGLEAVSLAIPPTPGQAVVRRPQYHDLFTLGGVLGQQGYQSRFWYGGYGYFDNMNGYFAANGYQVRDRLSIAKTDIPHENVWGVADEALYHSAVNEANTLSAKGQPFFMHIMTTSNHRPFTYPNGRIDLPSGSGRDGAVKYADWALGRFINEAQHQAWFKDTIFVILADHCASSAGKVELPVPKYHIPMLIYAPSQVAAGRFERLASQMDVAPTIMGLLRLPYISQFVGRDIFDTPLGQERAFISTYQTLGYLTPTGQLVTLRPRQAAKMWQVENRSEKVREVTADPAIVNTAIAWYQGASQLITDNRYTLRGKP